MGIFDTVGEISHSFSPKQVLIMGFGGTWNRDFSTKRLKSQIPVNSCTPRHRLNAPLMLSKPSDWAETSILSSFSLFWTKFWLAFEINSQLVKFIRKIDVRVVVVRERGIEPQ